MKENEKNKGEEGEEAEEIKTDGLEKNLSFMDGVILTHRIYERILQKQLKDEHGKPEKDNNGFSYLGIINDDINELLICKVLLSTYFRSRGSQLASQFGIDI